MSNTKPETKENCYLFGEYMFIIIVVHFVYDFLLLSWA